MKNKICPRCGSVLASDAPEGLCPRCLVEAGFETEPRRPAESGRAEPLSCDEVARYFPEMEIRALLGAGGMGAVYQAYQSQLDRLVAIKVLDRKARDPAFVERFTQEARTLARLNHPNIVAVHDFGERDGLFFLIMELVDGVTLRDLLREGKMAPERALAIVPPICDALQYAHEKGVVHRDVKPENILIDKEGRVKVADFGIARIVGIEVRDNLTGEGQMLGTAHYMAPEQASQPSEVDHRADIYAVGVVFYEMLTGELPLGRFPEPSKKVRIDVRLDEIVLKALEQEPERRYQQASEVRTAVTRVTETPAQPNASSRSAPPETRNSTGPWARRVFWIIATCFAVPIGLFLMSLIGYQLASLIGVRLTYKGITMITLVLAGIAFAMLLILRSLVRSFQREEADHANPWPRRIVILFAVIALSPVLLLAAFVFLLALSSVQSEAVTDGNGDLHSAENRDDEAGDTVLKGTIGDSAFADDLLLDARAMLTEQNGSMLLIVEVNLINTGSSDMVVLTDNLARSIYTDGSVVVVAFNCTDSDGYLGTETTLPDPDSFGPVTLQPGETTTLFARFSGEIVDTMNDGNTIHVIYNIGSHWRERFDIWHGLVWMEAPVTRIPDEIQ